jgi:hypothetical protein
MHHTPRLLSGLIIAVVLLVPACKTKKATQPEAPPPSGGSTLTPPAPGGAVHNVRQAVKRVPDSNQLRQFALFYIQYRDANQKAPSQLDDLKKDLDAKSYEAFKEGFYVAVWNVNNPGSNSVLAYVKDPDSYGTRMVAKGDASVERMDAQKFDSALKGQ